MTIDKIIEKFDEEILYRNKDGTRYNCMSLSEEKDIKDFLRSSYSELLGEIVESLEREMSVECDRCPQFNEGRDSGIFTAISIINSKLPKEDKNI